MLTPFISEDRKKKREFLNGKHACTCNMPSQTKTETETLFRFTIIKSRKVNGKNNINLPFIVGNYIFFNTFLIHLLTLGSRPFLYFTKVSEVRFNGAVVTRKVISAPSLCTDRQMQMFFCESQN